MDLLKEATDPKYDFVCNHQHWIMVTGELMRSFVASYDEQGSRWSTIGNDRCIADK